MLKNLILISITFVLLKAEAQTSSLTVADSLYSMGNYTKAIKAYEQYPKKEETFEKIAKAYVALGNYEQALSFYDKAYKSDSANVLLKYDYAKFLKRMKLNDEAETFFRDLLDADSQNPNFHYELGLILEKTPDSIIKAQESFHKAIQLDDTHQKAIFKVAKYHLAKRDHELAEKYINKGLESYVENKELMSLKAQNFYWQDMYDDAAVWFQKLVDLGESSQFLHEKLSFCYVRLYDNKNALLHCEKALKYDPNNSTNLYILGQIYQQEDDYANAEKYYKQALEIEDVPLDAEYVKLATVLNHQGKYEESIKTLQKALRENPDNIRARFFMLNTKTAYYEDIDEKIRLHEEFIKKYPDGWHARMAQRTLDKLKEEKFMQED